MSAYVTRDELRAALKAAGFTPSVSKMSKHTHYGKRRAYNTAGFHVDDRDWWTYLHPKQAEAGWPTYNDEGWMRVSFADNSVHESMGRESTEYAIAQHKRLIRWMQVNGWEFHPIARNLWRKAVAA